MRILAFFLLSILIALQSCKSTQTSPPDQTLNQQAVENNGQQVNFSEQSTWLLGYFNLSKLYSKPYSSWFVKGYDTYKYDETAVSKLREAGFTGLSIKIVLGTWCPDSRREVPRFFRVLDAVDFPKDKVELIGTDDSKFAPIENFAALDIVRVPTFIVFRNNIEVGRIIENPVTSLEQDMIDILSRNE